MKHLKKFLEDYDYEDYEEEEESAKFKRQLAAIDANDDFKYYVGYIKKNRRKKHYSWVKDGMFKGFNDHASALNFIQQIKFEGIPETDIDIFSGEKYAEIRAKKEQGI